MKEWGITEFFPVNTVQYTCICLILFFSINDFSSARNTINIPDPATILSSLKPNHPLLMLDNDGLARLVKLSETDTTLRTAIDKVMNQADGYCKRPALTYKPAAGARLLFVSRQCMDRMYTLGLAWRLTGDIRYARKAEEDLLAVCGLENWTPSLAIIYPAEEKHRQQEKETGRTSYSFLDVSEMCHAVGIGYDWFYHYLSEDSRSLIRERLIRNGLELGVSAYTGKGNPSGKPMEWIYYNHNWNQVCNGGLIVGALAIAETDPDYARIIIPHAVESLPLALATYGPDGAWPEGPSYWGYATQYTAFGLAALESSLGADFGLSDIDGLSQTGLFPIYTTGPTGLYLNFADSADNNRRRPMPCLSWLARRYDDGFIADSEHELIDGGGAETLHIIWYVPRPTVRRYSPGLDKRFRGPVEVAVFRSSWNDNDALFVGVKAGDNTFNHSHLDLGSFELDALGVRWARDLGADEYALPGYFDFYYLTKQRGGKRWTYYRNSSLSHNIPLIDGKNQDELAKASFTAFESGPTMSHVIVDLTEAYAPMSVKTRRGVAMAGERRAVLVQDEFDLTRSCDVAWGMTTDATIKVTGSIALLERGGRKLTARILSPESARFSVESAEQAPPQKTNAGVRRLMVHLKESGFVRIAVLLSPQWDDGKAVDDIPLIPLEEW